MSDASRPRTQPKSFSSDRPVPSIAMVETRGAQRRSMGLPPKQPTYASKGSKKELTTKEGHWSGAKKGGARGDSFLTNALSTLGVLALISTTPFIAIIVCVPLPDRAIGGPPRNEMESFASRLIVPV